MWYLSPNLVLEYSRSFFNTFLTSKPLSLVSKTLMSRELHIFLSLRLSCRIALCIFGLVITSFSICLTTSAKGSSAGLLFSVLFTFLVVVIPAPVPSLGATSFLLAFP